MVIQDCAGDGYCQMVLMVITTVALRTVTGDSANESGDGDNNGGDDNFSGGAGGEEVVEVQTEFDVILTGFGDKKLDVVKIVKAITGASLMESKKMVESCPATLKEAVSKEDADKVKEQVEGAGGSVELK